MWFLLLFLLSVECTPNRLDYHLTFKSPFGLPTAPAAHHFTLTGDAQISEKFIRLCPSLPHKQGAIVSDLSINHAAFQIDVSFKVSGRGFLGGKGLALWIGPHIELVHQEHKKDSVMGLSLNGYKGLGIILDTSNPAANRKNPFIYAFQTEGQLSKANVEDYTNPANRNILGGCFSDYRNTPAKAHLRIVYKDSILQVLTDMAQNGQGYVKCFEAHGVHSLQGYKVGMTAMTSEFAGEMMKKLMQLDDHDVYSFEVFQLDPPAKKASHSPHTLTEEEKKKIHHIEELVEEIQDEENPEQIESKKGDAVTTTTIQRVLENQFHIIQMLEIMSTREASKSSTASSSSGDLSGVLSKIGDVITLVQKLEDQMSNAISELKRIEDAIHGNLGTVHQSIMSTHSSLSNQNAQGNEHITKLYEHLTGVWSWVKYVGSVLVTALVLYGVLTLVRKREANKKFI